MTSMAPPRPSIKITPGRTLTDAAFRALRQAQADRLLMDDVDAIEDEYRPTLPAEYHPTAEDEAEWTGYLAGLEDDGHHGSLDAWTRRIDQRAMASLDELEAFHLDPDHRGPREIDQYAPGYCS